MTTAQANSDSSGSYGQINWHPWPTRGVKEAKDETPLTFDFILQDRYLRRSQIKQAGSCTG